MLPGAHGARTRGSSWLPGIHPFPSSHFFARFSTASQDSAEEEEGDFVRRFVVVVVAAVVVVVVVVVVVRALLVSLVEGVVVQWLELKSVSPLPPPGPALTLAGRLRWTNWTSYGLRAMIGRCWFSVLLLLPLPPLFVESTSRWSGVSQATKLLSCSMDPGLVLVIASAADASSASPYLRSCGSTDVPAITCLNSPPLDRQLVMGLGVGRASSLAVLRRCSADLPTSMKARMGGSVSDFEGSLHNGFRRVGTPRTIGFRWTSYMC